MTKQIVKLSPFSVIIMMTLIDGGGRYNLERAFRLLERLDAEPFATTSQLLRNQMDQLLGEVFHCRRNAERSIRNHRAAREGKEST